MTLSLTDCVTIVHGPGPMSDALDAAWGYKGPYCQAYDWTIYCVNGALSPSEAVIRHEIVHFEQQDHYPGGVQSWWDRYMKDAEFRLDQEVAAYGEDIRAGDASVGWAVFALTSALYGNLPPSVVQEKLEDYLREGA